MRKLKKEKIKSNGIEINVAHGGSGPPLLLLHGYPQTNLMWHKLVPVLYEKFYLVCPDLRGYGKSSKPTGLPDHFNYSKRVMGEDIAGVMDHFDFKTFQAVGHDRGGRVLHRMSLDYPERITRLCVMDIAPTHHMFTTTDKEFATGYYHWFFLIQPDGLPEKMIGDDPGYYLTEILKRWSGSNKDFDQEIVNEYIKHFSDPLCIHGSCEDYRAASTIDLVHDEEDIDSKISCPLLVLWGNEGFVNRKYDVLATWKERAMNVSGKTLDSGHFMAEENPEQVLEEILNFFDQ